MTHDAKGFSDDGSDTEFEALLAELRENYHVPPRPPLDEMWKRIETERPGARGRGPRASGPGYPPRTAGWAWGLWWMGVAAALLVGVGIGRLTSGSPRRVVDAHASRLPAQGAPARAPRFDTTVVYDQTTARYLGQTAALLVALPSEVRGGQPDHRFVARAAELLTTTRLLLDSPAAADPKVRALLEDVELVLAQVAHLESDRGGRVEYELITQALEQRDLLPRLHSAVAEGAGADN
jgi:hypothetical protein